MAAKGGKLKQILFKLETTAEFLAKVDPENKKLTVIDLHLNWCGPCECIEQNYRALAANHDNRVEFFTASEDVIPEDIKTNLQHGPLTCKPRFAVYVEGECKAEIDGADFTLLESSVSKYAPQLDD